MGESGGMEGFGNAEGEGSVGIGGEGRGGMPPVGWASRGGRKVQKGKKGSLFDLKHRVGRLKYRLDLSRPVFGNKS